VPTNPPHTLLKAGRPKVDQRLDKRKDFAERSESSPLHLACHTKFQERVAVIAFFSGWLAGTVHVLAGPDHLAAVAPLSVERQPRAWIAGVRWGMGHASGVILVGLLSLELRGLLPLHWLSSLAERLAGIVLVGIGIWGIRKAFTNHVHTHEHTHDGRTHIHLHVHSHRTAHRHAEAKAHVHTHAAFAIGALHGVAGSSHFLGVLPALAFASGTEAVAYLVAYGFGTITTMAVFSSLMSLVAKGASFAGATAYRILMLSCSTATVVVGFVWLAKNANP
jgi:sulfite exporter TauE/SafE